MTMNKRSTTCGPSFSIQSKNIINIDIVPILLPIDNHSNNETNNNNV